MNYKLDDRAVVVRFPAEITNVPLPQSVEIGSAAHPANQRTWHPEVFPVGQKRGESGANDSSPCSVQV
jgi:hypothetical protein